MQAMLFVWGVISKIIQNIPLLKLKLPSNNEEEKNLKNNYLCFG